MKPTREKRTTTQPGLGTVSAERRSTLGAGIETDPHIEHAPISAPPPSGGNRHGRMTLPLEKAVNQPEAQLAPPDQPASSARSRSVPSGADPRSDGEPSSSGRVERIDTQPRRNSSARQSFDVGGAEKKRVANRMSSKPPSSKPASSKPASFKPASFKPPPRPSKDAEARDLERRGSVGGCSAVEIATGRRPIAGTAGAPVAVAVAAAGPARSKRVSIREDNVGQRVNNVDAIGVYVGLRSREASTPA